MIVRLIPTGTFSKTLLNDIQTGIRDIFNVRSTIVEPINFPTETFNQWRRQYDGGMVLEILGGYSKGRFIEEKLPSIFLTTEDIYYNKLNFAFGIEDPQTKCSLISIARLKPEFYNQRPNNFVLKERVIKEVIHEIGHHLGLEHCNFIKCIMAFSSSAVDIDNKDKNFCGRCKLKLRNKGINID